MTRLDYDLQGVFERAAEMVAIAQNAHQAAENMGLQVEAMREHLRELETRLSAAEGEAAFYKTRTELLGRALRRWQVYARTRSNLGKSTATTHAYTCALAATNAALAEFQTEEIH